MAAKSFHKDLWRTLMQSKMRFLSILAIVALGVGFFAGIRATKPNMIRSADAYYQAQNLADFRLISLLGFREEDFRHVQAIDGIATLQAGYSLDVFLFSESGTRYTVRLFSHDPEKAKNKDSLNQLEALTGQLPDRTGQIVIEHPENGLPELALEETVTLQPPETMEEPVLNRQEFRIVGTVRSPLYINPERGQTPIGDGNVDLYGYICARDFSLERYNELYLRTESSPQLQAYSDAYDDHLEPIEKALILQGQEAMQAETSVYRQELEEGKEALEDRKDEANQNLEEARIKLEAAEEEIQQKQAELEQAQSDLSIQTSDAEEQLSEARSEYQQGLLQYYEGYAQWLEGYNEYQDGREQLSLRQQEIDAAENQLDMAKRELDLAQSQLNDAREQLDGLQTSIETLQSIRDDLPSNDEGLTQPQIDELVEQIRPFSDNLAETIADSVSPDDPGQLSQLRLLFDLAISQTQDAYTTGVAEYEAGLAEYQAGRREVAESEEELAAGKRELESGAAELEAGRQELDDTKALLDDIKTELDEANASILEAEQELETSRQEGQKQIDDGIEALGEARIELDAAWEEFEDEKEHVLSRIEEAEKDIRDMERQVLELPDEWLVMERSHQPGYSDYGDDARRIGAVAAVFPFFFFLVACLVCLTSMTRMVEEERVQIGTLKALGYNAWSISSKYILYALAASFIGSIVGLLIGFQIFPASIMNAYSLLYSIPVRLTPFHFDLAVISLLIAVAGTALVTLLASLHELRSTPAVLMQPRAPKPGKRILLEHFNWFWRRLTFMQKLTARNLFRYKQRFFMTIIGIAGCTALLLTGFGLRDSVNDILGLQFDEIFIYDGQLMLDPKREDDPQAIHSVLQDSQPVDTYLPVMHASVTVQGHDVYGIEATLIVPEDLESLPNFFTLRERETGLRLSLPPHGAIVTEKLADLLQIRVGDSVSIRDVDNRTYTMTVAAISENYVTHYVYMTPDYFDQITYRRPEYNSAVFNFEDAENVDDRAFQESLLEHESVLGSMLTMTLAEDFSLTLGSLDYVVFILILSAGALAFVVLYNLTSINIEERSREIATIKVLGFRDREVSSYVFRENMILTLLGTLAGLRLGLHLHAFVMNTMETDAIMFGQRIHWLSFLLAALLTLVFSVLVNLFMHYRLRRIELVASLKSVE